MKILDTLAGEKKELEKPIGRPLWLFVCGPTVYDYAQIGNARTYMVFDIIVRYLRSRGFDIFYLQNITDIDDKIINRAKTQDTEPEKLARKFEYEYLKDMKALNITSVNKYARATDYIPEIVEQVQTLEKKGFAYKIENDGYYFDVSKFKDYGKLSHRTAGAAEDAVSRIDESVNKKNRADFALWKFSKPGEPFWDTTLGKGRPGWHIEDTAITFKEFGPQYDMHGGGVDLKFPHHEAEIAQAEMASGKEPFVKIWMHTGFLLVNGKKMSKSLKNFITIREFLEKYKAETLRWMILSYHYRSPFDFTTELALQAKSSFNTIQITLGKLEKVLEQKIADSNPEIAEKIIQTKNNFEAAMADDFNTPAALAVVFEFINGFQKNIWELSGSDAEKIGKFLKNIFSSLGFEMTLPEIPEEISNLARERENVRSKKQFAEADELRKEAENSGYIIEDTPKGPFIWPKE